MTAIIGFNELGVQRTTQSVTVPSNPTAKLMYYLDCICCVLPIDENGALSRLRNYSNYYYLSRTEKEELLALCILLRPDILLDKCIFLAPELCIQHNNEFYNINSVNKVLAVSDSLIIGGERKQVLKIMTFKEVWLKKNYLDPLLLFSNELKNSNSSNYQRTIIAQTNSVKSGSNGCC